MSWPASTQYLIDALTKTNETALRLKTVSTNLKVQSLAGPVNRVDILNYLRKVSEAIERWNTAKNVNGIVTYVQDQFADPSLNVSEEFNGMINAAMDVKDWIETNFPTDDTTGAVLTHSLDINGNLITLTFTTAQLGGFRTECDKLIASIG